MILYNVDCKAVKANNFFFFLFLHWPLYQLRPCKLDGCLVIQETRDDQICSRSENKHKKEKPKKELSETICIVPLTKLQFLCNTVKLTKVDDCMHQQIIDYDNVGEGIPFPFFLVWVMAIVQCVEKRYACHAIWVH